MDEKSQEVLEAALSLPENQRASLVGALLETLPSETDEWDDDELASELDRRLEEALRDPSSTASWTDLKNRS
jgi:putative addiction module component (TIGR02574 family)